MGGVMKGESILHGVVVQPLKVIPDDRGAVLHMLRESSPSFSRFGEIYFSEVNPGKLKAWKRHLRMTQRFAVPVGRLKFAIYDPRPESPTQGQVMQLELGRPECYLLLLVPPGLWYGFQNAGAAPALLANCADLAHDPTESQALPASAAEIPFRWSE